MRKKSLLSIMLGICVLLLIASFFQFVSAEIIISQPKAIYNLGDVLSGEIKIDSIKTGYLDINLVCLGVEKNIYHNVPDSATISLSRKLTPTYIENLSGNCLLKVSYGSEEQLSQGFRVSKVIDVELKIENATYMAGESLTLKGTAIKENNLLVGQDYSGFVEATINVNNESLSSSDTIKDGQFSLNFKIPSTLRAGVYSMNIRVYEKDSNDLLSDSSVSSQINVAQKPARIELAIDKTSLVPGEEIFIVPMVYDMAGDLSNQNIILTVKGADSNIYYQKSVASGLNITLKTETNYLPGFMEISAKTDNMNASKEVQITELKKIKSEINNKTLIITNIGNVAYKDVVEINVGSQDISKELDLPFNGRIEFYLTAPNGFYDINVKSSSNEFMHSGVALTGNTIDAREAINNVFSNYPIAWAFVVLVLILLAYVLIRRYLRNKKMHFGEFNRQQTIGKEYFKKKDSLKVITPETTKKNIDNIILNTQEIKKAQYEMVLHGKKHNAGIVAIKIKSQLSGIEKTNLNKALEYAYALKGVSYSSNDYVLLIFSPLLTGKQNNEDIAIRAATDIDVFLREHNRKFRNNLIGYGIGVTSGEIVNAIEKDVFKFASINKTLAVAKKIANISNEEVLLSKEIHEKTMNNVKAEKVDPKSLGLNGSIDLFRIKRIVDGEASRKFINEFMRRQ
jgi:hypothetical protein